MIAADPGDRYFQIDPVAVTVPVTRLELFVALIQDPADLSADLRHGGNFFKVGNAHAHDLLVRVAHHAAIAGINVLELAVFVEYPVAIVGAVYGFFGITCATSKPEG